MKFIKDFVLCVPVAILLLFAVFAFDDSFEDSKLSAQVLDEAIAHANLERRRVSVSNVVAHNVEQ